MYGGLDGNVVVEGVRVEKDWGEGDGMLHIRYVLSRFWHWIQLLLSS